jgi:ABC-type uncharacterized transport system substrate-binding protein
MSLKITSILFLCLFFPAAALCEIKRVAYVSSSEPTVTASRVAELRSAIAELSPKNGSITLDVVVDTFFFDIRSVDSDANLGLTSRIRASGANVIFIPGASATRRIAAEVKDIPIVIGCKCNPSFNSRTWKFVKDLCAPEANITGFTRYDLRVIDSLVENNQCSADEKSSSVKVENLNQTRFEILKSLLDGKPPRIGMVFSDAYDETKWQYASRAKALGILLVPIKIEKADIVNLGRIYANLNISAALVLADGILDANTPALIEATKKLSIPTMFPWDEADNGAWMHFGTKVDSARQAASYIVPILQGKAIRELPVSFPKEYELVVNHKLAKEHGWVFPKKFLLYPQREPKPQ